MTEHTLLLAQGTPPNWPGPIRLYITCQIGTGSIETNSTPLTCTLYLTTPPG